MHWRLAGAVALGPLPRLAVAAVSRLSHPHQLQAIGRICDISQDLLGATVLAWGEAVPELAATLSLARQGQGGQLTQPV